MVTNSKIRNQLNAINLIHLSLMAGMLLFLIVVIVLIQGNQLSGNIALDKIFTILVPVYGLLIMFISRMIYNLIISRSLAGTDLTTKIVKYRSAKIVSWALMESGCLFSLIATMLTSNYLYIAVFVFLLGYFFMLKPSRESLVNDMQLNSSEKDAILSK
jgi:hypothetical protein